MRGHQLQLEQEKIEAIHQDHGKHQALPAEDAIFLIVPSPDPVASEHAGIATARTTLGKTVLTIKQEEKPMVENKSKVYGTRQILDNNHH